MLASAMKRLRWSRALPQTVAVAPEPPPPARPPIDVLEEAPVPALRLRGAVVLSANASARRFFDLEPGRLPLSLIEATREARLMEVLTAGEVPRRMWLVHSQRLVEISLVQVPDPEGHAILFLTDVTSLQRLETVRQEFVANLTHELKTPLASLRLAAESLVGDPPQQTRRRFAQRVVDESAHLAAILDNLRQLTEIEGGRLSLTTTTFDLRRVVVEAAERMPIARPMEIGIPKGVGVSADRGMVAQVLANLLDNAAKFSPEQSVIEVEAHQGRVGVIVSVRDHGPGLSPEHWDRVFERFYKVDPSRTREPGGSGLGLAIAKHLVLALGGEIWTETAEDGGQVFSFSLQGTLPAASSQRGSA
jgi:two-component system phosphate regulon sensor histidine kinase PhoR